MKFHKSYAVLEEQNRGLRQERDALLTQLDAAHEAIAALQKRLGRPSTKTQHRSVKNVAKLHKAVPLPPAQRWGVLDTTPFSSPSLTDYTKLVYRDGKLIDTECRNAGYMKHTEASAKKTTDPWTALNAGVMYTTKLRESQLNPSESVESEPGPESEESQLSLPTPDIPYDEEEDQNDTERTLSLLTRLNNPQDDAFFSDPATGASIIQLPFSLQMSLLERAYDLVRQGTFLYIKTHWPKSQLRYFPEHWKQIRFGFTELEDSGFSRGRTSSDRNKDRIADAMFSIIPLRNILCHPSYVQDLKCLDSLLKSAQGLLVLLDDERRALEVRGLRERIQEEAREILSEIERREGFKTLPGDEEPWPIHIQLMFEHVLQDLQKERMAPEVIVRAAREWRSRGYRVGEDEAGFQERVEEARERMRLVEVVKGVDSGTSSESGSESSITSGTDTAWSSDSTTAVEQDLDKLAASDAGDGWSNCKAIQSRAPESWQTGW
ncbi:hypothetical protein HII31_12193 [Pseudocercospora fuligena]|uniref:Uncharacterized protein n=1 Tax=Pseudocercospora fuligena TaxID=685502 RepID=A0A8H6R8F5_9PEZI|nr:hypothetical protein HII31_12193 [Pseudocercospora fuligena]